MLQLHDVLLILITSLSIIAAIMVILAYLRKSEREKATLNIKSESKKEIILLRLQAIERLVLLLERISPQAMVMRLDKSNKNTKSFYLQLIQTVRSEFDHNVAQQVYISNENWKKVVSAKEAILNTINASFDLAGENGSLSDFIKLLINNDKSKPLVENAIISLKEEAASLF